MPGLAHLKTDNCQWYLKYCQFRKIWSHWSPRRLAFSKREFFFYISQDGPTHSHDLDHNNVWVNRPSIGLSVTRKKLPNVYKSCPKIISREKLKILTPLQKLPKNVGDLGKISVAKGLKSCPKSNKLPILVTLVGLSRLHLDFFRSK